MPTPRAMFRILSVTSLPIYAQSISFNYYFRLAHVLHVERCYNIMYKTLYYTYWTSALQIILINPRCACAVRVIVIVVCVCMYVCMCVCMCVCMYV